MGLAPTPTRHNRTLTSAFHEETPSAARLDPTQALGAFGLAFLLALGLQRRHTASCSAGGSRTRHAHSARLRLGGLTLWRVQGPTCPAVCTVLPPCVLRSRQRRPAVARAARLAPPGGRSWARGAGLGPLSPRAG